MYIYIYMYYVCIYVYTYVYIYICLYREDGLAIGHKTIGLKVDRLRKDIISSFKDEGPFITIDTNLIETDFLDVSFNLNTGKYFPCKKPSNTPLYIDTFKI